MIGKLRGKIDHIDQEYLIIDVNGVGYVVNVSNKTLNFLSDKKNQEISLIIETIVREDNISLFGFISELEKSWFNELGKVKGVGNKVALKILGSLTIDEIILAISSQDKSLFCRTPGVGPKLALRIVSELKDSVNKIAGSTPIGVNDNMSDNQPQTASTTNSQILNDAISALENLGYKRSQIYSIANKEIANNPEITLETLITQSLRQLSK